MSHSGKATPLILCTLLLGPVISVAVQAQTFTVLHNFTGGTDGSMPFAGLSMDAPGNLYGTTLSSVFKLSHKGSGWIFAPLYNFLGGNDGQEPFGGVIVGPDGSLYGTTIRGGGNGCSGGLGCGTVFNLRPPPTACKTALCPWNETVLYRFTGGSDGSDPRSDLIFDHMGNLYGTTTDDGVSHYGTVFQLTPSGAGWAKTVLYSFTGGADGASPSSGLVFDVSGNLYGTALNGGYDGCFQGCGLVYELMSSGGGWSEKVLYAFQGGSDGEYLPGGVIFDASGNLYGGTYQGGSGGGGTAFRLTPLNGNWMLLVLYGFTGQAGVSGSLAIDRAGNLYGATTDDGAYGNGSVFKLTPTGEGWTYTDLYDFTGGSDGQGPLGSVIVDAQGNVYGTTYLGGTYGYGVVWEIKP